MKRKSRQLLNAFLLGLVIGFAKGMKHESPSELDKAKEGLKETEEHNLNKIKEGLREVEEDLQELNKSLGETQTFNEAIQKVIELAPELGQKHILETMQEEATFSIKIIQESIKKAETSRQSLESLLAKHQGDEHE